MAQKTLYVRDEDQEVWREAEKLSKEGSVAAFVADALRAHIDRVQSPPPPDAPKGAVAPYGQKMIEARLRFWTDGLHPEKGQIWPKHAWSQGMVAIEANKAHGIKPSGPVPFNSIFELTRAIEDLLVQQGVVLHTNRKTAKLLQPAPPKSKPS